MKLNLSYPELFKTKSYINGKWIDSENSYSVKNPFDGKEITKVGDATVLDCQNAITAANEAFVQWSKQSAGRRSKILQKWKALQLQHINDLAQILTLEQGKPLAEAKGEIKYGASFVEWYAEEAKRIYGDVIPGQSQKHRITVIKQPVGVIGAITPWNFPSAMITRKVAPALASGCTLVLKPSEFTPLSALALAQLAEEAGIPPGVFNVVTSTNAQGIGKELCNNKKVKKISFTGSTRVGKILLKQSADTVKRVSLELGGNAPFIVFDDADIDKAVEGCITSKFRNAGQTCICSNRIFVQDKVYDEFVAKLSPKVSALKVGNGFESDTVIGPMINEKAIASVEHMLEEAVSKGGKIVSGGKTISDLLFEPTLVTEVSPGMEIFNKEIFGPIAAIYRFKTEEEVIALANDTDYGLASYFYGKDYARIWRVAEALEYGMVGINTGMISTAVAPFGGVKESGFGKEGSKYGIDDFVNVKYMCWEI